jgi:hypothetical protein
VSETGFRLAVAGAAIILIAGVAHVRFGNTPALPPRPATPPMAANSADKLLTSSLGSPAVWKNFLETDARAAGVTAPTPEQMAKRFIYRSDVTRRELTLASPKLTVAGLNLTLERGEGELVLLAVENPTDQDLAYRVVSSASPGASVCNTAAMVATNAMVLGKGATERRTVCVFRSDLVLTISKVEVMEVPSLSAWYLQQVSPQVVGLESRLTRAHRVDGRPLCAPIQPQSVRGSLETGDLGWRDLVDFYARHRCETYQFPVSYRAFTRDNERALPVVPQQAP